MKNFVSYFIKYPVAGNVIMILILLFGYFGLKSLKKTFFPEVESKIISVQVIYPGASPEEIEKGIVLKIEDNLRGVTGVEEISSTSKENTGSVTVEVEKDYDTDLVLQDVKNAIDRINSFPDGMEPPAVYKMENLNFVISFVLSGDVNLRVLKQYAQKVESDLLAIEGISKVGISGYPEEEIEIAFREADLQAYNLTFQQALNAVRGSNIEITGGTIKTPTEEYLIRANTKKYYADELKDIVLKAANVGTIIRLKDVANVTDKWEDNPNRTYLNNNPSVTITVQNTIREDILQISEDVKAYMAQFNQENTVVQTTLIRDGSTTIRDRIDLLVENGILGFFLVLIILALFLNIRLAFWVALSIPISFAGMFILGAYFDLTLNVMSLFAMILVIGILVDDGIVIAENIYQQHEKGESALKAAINGTIQVLPAVTSAVLTTMIAFSAFFFLDGRIGEFASDLAFVVIGTLLFSLVEGAIILPSHIGYSKALERYPKLSKFDKTMAAFENQTKKIMVGLRSRVYDRLIRLSLRYRFAALTFPIAALIITFGAIGGKHIKFTFFPNIERDNIDVTIQLPAGAREDATMAILDIIEEKAWQLNSELSAARTDSLQVFENIFKQIGPGANVGKLSIQMINNEIRGIQSFQVTNMLRDLVGPLYGLESVSFGATSPFGKPISVSLLSSDLNQLSLASTMLEEKMSELTSIKDIGDNNAEGIKEIKIQLKDKAYLLGLDIQTVINQVRQGFFGGEVQRLQRGLDEVKVWVRFSEQERSSLSNLENMRIRTANGVEVPLKEVADYHIERGIIAINHIDGKRVIRVEADLANPKESAPEILADITDNILPQILAKYPSVSYTFEGQSKQSKKTGDSAKQVIPIIFILMIAVVWLTFRSLSQSITIFLLLIFGIIGVGWGHYIHGYPISILSGFGVIALIGIMVNDSLVMVSALNENLKEGMKFQTALLEAASSRFRPIILTSVTTIAGLAPLILEKSFQAQFLIPMAISVAYGLAIATYVTLMILPVMLSLLNDLARHLKWLKAFVSTFNHNTPIPTAEEVENAVTEVKTINRLKDDH